MSKFTNFLGIDVSKDYFDSVIMIDGKHQSSVHNQFENSYKGLKSLHKWLKDLNCNADDTLICLEHTGIYGKLIIKHLLIYGYSVWVEMSLKIIRSIGVQRGKNDKLDAARIAYYAFKNAENAVIYQAPREIIEKIRSLLALRDKLVATRSSLLKTQKELEIFDQSLSKLTSQYQRNTIKGLENDLKKIETQVDFLINSDGNLERIFKQSTSVPGIGKITALYLICFTNEFKWYSTPRQLACYCGVVPFEYTSGKSVKGRPKVHYMANKKLKKQLHMCAMTACYYDPETKIYFEKKVAEGKSKMLVINNVRNKLVHRVCACIRDNKMYEARNVV